MKKRLRKTGEIVDVISFTAPCGANRSDINDFVSYVDSKGNECVNVPLNYYWDFENIEEVKSTDIDWNQRRYEIAKSAMRGILNNESIEISLNDESYEYHCLAKDIAKASVIYADAIIDELKKEHE